MANSLIRRAVAALAALCIAAPALAEEVRIESENIVLYGDVRADFAEDFVRQMEVYRRMILALSGQDGFPPDKQKLTIFGFYTAHHLQKFAGRGEGLAGVYTLSQDGPIFLTPIKRREGNGDWASQVALHEYSHHVLHALVEDEFPRWYDEGFANYLSTLEISDEQIALGSPNVSHTQHFVHRIGWLPPEVVINAVDRYPSIDGSGWTQAASMNNFYAQSWLYVHYLQSHPELGGKLPDYIDAIKRGTGSVAAFEAAFGLSLADFHSRAVAYFDANAFEVIAFEPQGDFMAVDVTVTPISRSRLAYEQLAGQMAFLSDRNDGRFEKLIELAAKEHAGDPLVSSARAALAVQQEDYGQAVSAAQRALAARPDDAVLLRTLADARFHQLQQGGANADLPDDAVRVLPSGAAFTDMADGFARVLELLPDDRTAATHLLTAYAMSDAPITPTARRAVETVEDKHMTRRLPGMALDLAAFHLRAGNTERGCSYLGFARAAAAERKPDRQGRLPATIDWVDARHAGACGTQTAEAAGQ